MAKEKPEDKLEAMLRGQYEGGTVSAVDLIRLVEEVKAYRAQQKASVYALWAAGFAGLSATVSALSIVVSLMRH
jgi:Mrp family chromosome partitioning ATPase